MLRLFVALLRVAGFLGFLATLFFAAERFLPGVFFAAGFLRAVFFAAPVRLDWVFFLAMTTPRRVRRVADRKPRLPAGRFVSAWQAP